MFVVLLDPGVLVVHVQAGGDAGGDHPGAERSRCRVGPAADQLAVEDQGDLVGAADVEVVADDVFEEHPARNRLIEQLGQRELGLQNRQLVAVARGPIRSGERVRQPGQPLAQQRIDLLFSEPVADPLQSYRIIDGGEAVVQRGEPDLMGTTTTGVCGGDGGIPIGGRWAGLGAGGQARPVRRGGDPGRTSRRGDCRGRSDFESALGTIRDVADAVLHQSPAGRAGRATPGGAGRIRFGTDRHGRRRGGLGGCGRTTTCRAVLITHVSPPEQFQ